MTITNNLRTSPTTHNFVSQIIEESIETESRSLLVTAALTAAIALHLSFAVLLIKTGTEGERVYAQRAVEATRTVADLGTLPAITVVARRAS